MNKSAVGCDTLVALPQSTAHGCVIFGKNSDRPGEEVQEVVFVPAKKHAPGDILQCTYIEIPEVVETHACILSKPAWMWGAEMGANDKGVVIGNEAVWTKFTAHNHKHEKLLGMDLLRLGLERGKTAEESMKIITNMLEKYGQGGACAEDECMTYDNSFLIADSTQAWILETADKHWAAKKISEGVRNISNNLTITDDFDLLSCDMKEAAEKAGFYKPPAKFNFAKCVSSSGKACDNPRQINGTALLNKYATDGKFSAANMIEILRDENSGICMTLGGGHVSTGSQVSILPPVGSGTQAIHFFTGTPDPSLSVFKPFIFNENENIHCPQIVSPTFENDRAKVKPRFEGPTLDRRHILYKTQQNAMAGKNEKRTKEQILNLTREMEKCCVEEIVKNVEAKKIIPDAENLFKDCIEAEINIYKN